jgi:SEC-C motif
MSARSRNGPCPCGSGRKFERCCADALDHPKRTAQQHDAVGRRIQAWAFEHHGEAMRDAFAEITSGYADRVLGDSDLQLIGSWMFNDRQLRDGGTVAERYAQRDDLSVAERDVAGRIAAARLGLLRVVGAIPGRWIDLYDLAVGGEVVRAISHDVSRYARQHTLLVGRLMDGPPAPTLWGPVGFLTRQSGRELRELLHTYIDARASGDAAAGLAAAIHAASREITVMLAPALGPANASPKAA